MKERDPADDGKAKKHHGPDWEHGAPEWVPPGEKSPERHEPAKKGVDEGSGPAKVGDPPIEEPFGERSRHGGSERRPPSKAPKR
jgi:hypothetical protein